MCIYYEMITIVRLINIAITLYSYNSFLCMLRTYKIYPLSTIKIYSTVLLTILTMLYITSSELTDQ